MQYDVYVTYPHPAVIELPVILSVVGTPQGCTKVEKYPNATVAGIKAMMRETGKQFCMCMEDDELVITCVVLADSQEDLEREATKFATDITQYLKLTAKALSRKDFDKLALLKPVRRAA